MLVIRLGEIVSMPLAARLARKAVDKRLCDASVTPRAPVVSDVDLEPGGSKDYDDYLGLRQQCVDLRRMGKKLQPAQYNEVDLRLFTLPGADMITEYKELAQIYLEYAIPPVTP